MKTYAKPAAIAVVLLLLTALALWNRLATERGAGPSAARGAAGAELVASRAAEQARPDLEGADVPRREAAPPAPATPPVFQAAAPDFAGRVSDVAGNRVGPIPIYREAQASAAERGEPFAVADASGVFTWETPAWAALVAESEELTTVLPAFAGSGACVIVVAPRRSYAGVVLDETGSALEGARLFVQMEAPAARNLVAGEERARARSWAARSGLDGTFVLAGVGWTEELALVAELDGFVTERVLLPPQSTRSLEVRLHRPAEGARSITGTVVDAAAEPVEGATVAFETGKGITTDREGRFVIEAPKGPRAVLWAVKPGRAPARHEFADLEAYLATAPRAPLVLTLGERPESIAGIVLEEGGAPIAGAWVFTWDMQRWELGNFVESLLTDEDFPGRATTASDGRFTIEGLLPHAYTLHALHPRTLAVATREAVPAGTRDVRLVLGGAEPTRRVAGHVLDPRGVPVPGVILFYGRQSTARLEHLRAPLVTGDAPRTDASGAFEFPALCVEGAYLLPAGEDIAQQESFALDPAMDLEHLVVTVSRTCRFQVVLLDPAEADHFTVLDGADERMWLGYTLGDMALSSNGSMDLAGGRSEVIEADERARTIVLSKGGGEVRREPIRLVPGEVQILEL
jgi:protocatechuate 3,4-dioxygenase beta subunit